MRRKQELAIEAREKEELIRALQEMLLNEKENLAKLEALEDIELKREAIEQEKTSYVREEAKKKKLRRVKERTR